MARARTHAISTGEGPVEVLTLARRGEYYVHSHGLDGGPYTVTHGPTGLSVRQGLASLDLAVHFASYVATRARRTPDDTPFGAAGYDAVVAAVRDAVRGYRTPPRLLARARAAGGAE